MNRIKNADEYGRELDEYFGKWLKEWKEGTKLDISSRLLEHAIEKNESKEVIDSIIAALKVKFLTQKLLYLRVDSMDKILVFEDGKPKIIDKPEDPVINPIFNGIVCNQDSNSMTNMVVNIFKNIVKFPIEVHIKGDKVKIIKYEIIYLGSTTIKREKCKVSVDEFFSFFMENHNRVFNLSYDNELNSSSF